MATGYFPTDFKLAKVVMIPKQGKNQNRVENYRPISLLEVPGKILERIISVEVTQHLEDENVLSINQHGFRKGRGTYTAIALAHETCAKNINNGKFVSIVLRDVKGAFDKVWHHGLRLN